MNSGKHIIKYLYSLNTLLFQCSHHVYTIIVYTGLMLFLHWCFWLTVTFITWWVNSKWFYLLLYSIILRTLLLSFLIIQ